MRFGQLRGVTLAVALMTAVLCGSRTPAQAGDIFHRVIPRYAPAIDYRTGQEMYAPPVPYGHYAKDPLGHLHGGGLLHGGLGFKHHGLFKGGACSNCGGSGCNQCGNDPICQSCTGKGCSMCGGVGRLHGLFGHKRDSACDPCGTDNGSCFSGHGGSKVCGLGQPCGVLASAQGGPSGQTIVESTCGSCFGKGCGLCGGLGKLRGRGLFHKGKCNPCGSCGGQGCESCGGQGCLGDPGGDCGACGGKGCGLCGGKGHFGGLCRGCGGAGCGLCGHFRGALGKLCHGGKVKYFVGAGGPVPLTPGYVPYIISTRSPRDFFAFPPMSNSQP
jgi:hypothetical protein